MDKVYECDLHAHTNRSDGNDTYEEIITRAGRRGVRILVICDHDVRPLDKVELAGGGTAPLGEYASSRHVTVIPGIEFSCNTLVEDVHIVALGCDFDHEEFYRIEKEAVSSKINAYRELCRRLTAGGMPLSWDEVLEQNQGRIAPEQVQKKQIFEKMAQKGYTRDWQSAKKLVSREPLFSVQREKPDPVDIIRLVHRTGGYCILAHPYLIAGELLLEGRSVSREEYIEHLISNGLDGIEAAYTYNKTSYKGNMSPEEIEQEIRRRYTGRVRMISGGSDYHHDALKGVKNARELGEKGLTMKEFMSNPYFCRLLKIESNNCH